MAELEAETAAQVCRIASDLSGLESPGAQAGGESKRYSLGGALASLWKAPTQALAHTLFRAADAAPAGGRRLRAVESELIDAQDGRHRSDMVWLTWDDCRCLSRAFRALEYVDATGQPTALVRTHVSRLTAGEAVGAQEESGGDRRRRLAHDGGGGSSSSEEQARGAAWALISRVFARATALRVSAEEEEAGKGDALAVLTWFPQLEYLEVQGIRPAALRFWSSWLPPTLWGLKIAHAGVDLNAVLGLAGGGGPEAWARLGLLDLSDNPGISLESLGGPLVPQRLPGLARVSLARCGLDSVPEVLAGVLSLAWLDLRGNAIADVADMSLRVGGIARLCLAQNGLADVSGLRRLWALEVLDVSDNALAEWTALLPLRNLPSLRELAVRGNPLAEADLSHRVQIFSAFDHRDVALALDGRGPTGAERREMAKVARVATEHRAGAPAAMVRRPKVAVIEESDAGTAEQAGRPGSPAKGGDHRPGSAQAASRSTAAVPEKPLRVLRAAELQEVAVASAHRRSKVPDRQQAEPDDGPARARGQFRRRATATALGGAAGVDIARESKRQAAHSVPASYGARPVSPVLSVSGSPRDPERYRRRVEMMRAEAGSSWLRAFTELQAQTPSSPPSPSPPALSPASPPANLPRSTTAGSLQRAEAALPTSLFPRRKQAAPKDVARLPHYPRDDTPQAASDSQPSAPEDGAADASNGDSGDASSDNGGSAGEHGEEAEAIQDPAPPDELQRLMQGEGVEAAVDGVEVTRFRFVEAGDGGSSSAVERVDCGQRAIYVTATEVIEVADDGTGERRIAARVPISALTRGRSEGGGGELVEIKAGRLDAPQWIVYGCSSGGEVAGALRAAVAANTARGQMERVYRQAECLRCSWKGSADHSRTVWDALQCDQPRTAVPPAPAELRCPACGRAYLREFYAEPDGAGGSAAASEAWARSQPLPGPRRRTGAARRGKDSRSGSQADGSADAEHVRCAQQAAAADVERLGGLAADGALAFGEVTNAIRLFLQLRVFAAEGERLVQWVPAGLVRQVPPLPPAAPPARPSSAGGSSGGRWALPAFLGSAAERATETDWRAASGALAPETAEQAAYVALSTHAIYAFTPTWDALRAAGQADVELQPEQHLGLLFAIPLGALGRIDVGPNRQYIALHAALLAEDAAAQWSAAALPRLVPTATAAYPPAASPDDASERRPDQLYVARPGSLQRARRAPRQSLLTTAAAAPSSCVFMLRDRLACSDLLDALVEIGYETRVLDSASAAAGSGRLRALNHDVEWAMHHLVRQVFLHPATFADADVDDGDDVATSARRQALRAVRDELQRSRSTRQPAAMVDPAGGGAAIVDQVTYEFLRLYLCVARAVPGVGMEPLTLVASPHFVYVVRERVDVWPPPVPDLRALYRKWQREPPPTIVTSDPDAYDPQALAAELARRANGAAAAVAPEPAAPEGDGHLAAQLVAAAVDQYDCLVHARPVADLRRIVLVPRTVAVVPAPEDPADPHPADVLGCTAAGWRAMLRIEFDTVEGDSAWCLWFASVTSAQECCDALAALASAAGAAVDICTAPRAP